MNEKATVLDIDNLGVVTADSLLVRIQKNAEPLSPAQLTLVRAALRAAFMAALCMAYKQQKEGVDLSVIESFEVYQDAEQKFGPLGPHKSFPA